MSLDWKPFREDPVAEATGISFDRTPAGDIKAPNGMFRVCAYHIDFDEAPVCYVDVATLAEAKNVCEALSKDNGGYNVDYALVWDDRGKGVHSNRPW